MRIVPIWQYCVVSLRYFSIRPSFPCSCQASHGMPVFEVNSPRTMVRCCADMKFSALTLPGATRLSVLPSTAWRSALDRQFRPHICLAIGMTPAQLRLLQRSYAKIEPMADQFGAIFYARLFTIAPEIRPLFRTDLKAQQSKFMKVIKEVVQLYLRAIVSLAGDSGSLQPGGVAGRLLVRKAPCRIRRSIGRLRDHEVGACMGARQDARTRGDR